MRSLTRMLGRAPLALSALAALGCEWEPAAPHGQSTRVSGGSVALASSAGAGGPGVIVLAGGGAEGNAGDTGAWSYRLYSRLVLNGDVTGDGVVRVAVISRFRETNWIPNYFEWIGRELGVKVVATNYAVTSVDDANSSAVVGAIGDADAVFIKGGDQGRYYDLWNETLLERVIAKVASRGGALGGTSAGAMSLAQYCLCSGQDYVSADVLADARTPQLDDLSEPGTSGIHADFLPYVDNTTIDTHLTTRGRLGRMLGTLAKATDDFGDWDILAVGLENKTGVAIRGGIAEVIGDGEAAFVRQRDATSSARIRDARRPLVYTNLLEDRLTDGWRFNLATRSVVTSTLPPGVTAVSYPGDGPPNAGALEIEGKLEGDNAKFEFVAAYEPSDYSLSTTSVATFVRRAVGFTNSESSSNRGSKHETLFRALYDHPEAVGMLVFSEGELRRTASAPDKMAFAGGSATVVVDARGATYKGLSPYLSNLAVSPGGTLRAAALTNLTVHVLAESAARGMYYDTRTHAVVR